MCTISAHISPKHVPRFVAINWLTGLHCTVPVTLCSVDSSHDPTEMLHTPRRTMVQHMSNQICLPQNMYTCDSKLEMMPLCHRKYSNRETNMRPGRRTLASREGRTPFAAKKLRTIPCFDAFCTQKKTQAQTTKNPKHLSTEVRLMINRPSEYIVSNVQSFRP